MELSKYSVAFVCSSLPFGILNQNIQKWKINQIILNNNIHLKTYNHLIKNHPDVKLKVLPGGLILNSIFLFVFFLKFKRENNKLYFFHECCATLFDLFVIFFNPKAKYIPQVKIDSLPLCKKPIFSKESFLLISLFQLNKFSSRVNNSSSNFNEHSLVWTCNKYPNNTKVYDVGKYKLVNKSKEGYTSNKIILLISKDIFYDKKIIESLKKVIDLLKRYNFEIHLKNHPNKDSRLSFFSEYVKVIDPTIPFELISYSYKITIGIFTTSLLNSDAHSISIAYLIDQKTELFKTRIKHLIDHPNNYKIYYPKSINEFKVHLDNL